MPMIPATSVSYETAMMQAKTATSAAPKAEASAAQDFEAMFLSEMLSHVFEGEETDPVFGGGKGEDMFRGMMVSEYGKMIAKGGGLGLAPQITKALVEMQEVQP